MFAFIVLFTLQAHCYQCTYCYKPQQTDNYQLLLLVQKFHISASLAITLKLILPETSSISFKDPGGLWFLPMASDLSVSGVWAVKCFKHVSVIGYRHSRAMVAGLITADNIG